MLKGFAERAYQLIFLWLMKDGPVYGYELANRFEKMTKGHIKVSYGTVYPFLRRMESGGLISSIKDESSGRVYYELTSKGKLALEKLPSKLEEYQEYFNEKLLGFLAIYLELFGREALNKLLKRI
ncbi:MAG: PadR family transcriptional regulator [archaeon]|nr:PadR family transcriptional regulator [archaeon]